MNRPPSDSADRRFLVPAHHMIGGGEHDPRHAGDRTGLAEFRGHIEGGACLFPRSVRIGILRRQMNDRIDARKRVGESRAQQISLNWDQARDIAGEAGHIAVDRMNRGDVGRRQEGRDQLRPILPLAPVIATRSAECPFIISPLPSATRLAFDRSRLSRLYHHRLE